MKKNGSVCAGEKEEITNIRLSSAIMCDVLVK